MSRHHLPILSAAIVALFAMMLFAGCEALHRDIEKELPPDDVGGVGDAEQDVDDVGDDCEPGESCGPCGLGEIYCQNGQPLCGGSVNLDDDDDHCGECDNACETSIDGGPSFCDDGQCVDECSSEDETYCENAGVCVSLDDDVDHCGACDNSCPDSASCEDGQCIVECSSPDETYCENDDVCVDLDSDIDHCGACDNSCPDSASCEDGQCVVECSSPDETYCEDDDVCVDLDSDIDHCGACDNPCEPSSVPDSESFCEAGDCVVECPSPDETHCEDDDVCVDLDSDIEYCGACDNSCLDLEGDDDLTCVEGECTCDDDEVICDDECVDLQTDDDHCGSCGNNCPGFHTCVEGECENV